MGFAVLCGKTTFQLFTNLPLKGSLMINSYGGGFHNSCSAIASDAKQKKTFFLIKNFKKKKHCKKTLFFYGFLLLLFTI